jgi:cytochrome c oxidase accessory protein FixG
VKAAEKARTAGEPAGDCIDCRACINACPTGVDIRDGMQLGCIQCGLCIDACDTMMEKVGREAGLIGYDTDMNIARRSAGKPPVYRIVRPRTVLYAALIAIAGSVMIYGLVTREFQGINVLHDRNPIAVKLSDGGARNGYTVRLLNKRPEPRTFTLAVEGLPPGAQVEAIGIDGRAGDKPLVAVDPDTTRELRVTVAVPGTTILQPSTPLKFRIVDIASGETAVAADFFKLP